MECSALTQVSKRFQSKPSRVVKTKKGESRIDFGPLERGLVHLKKMLAMA